MANRQNLDLASSVSATVVNIVLNVFLIPKYGNMGSAFATLISMCLFCALELFFARDLIRNLRIVHSLCISAALCIPNRNYYNSGSTQTPHIDRHIDYFKS